MKRESYYHSSPYRMRSGTILVPGGITGKRNYNSSLDNYVYMTMSPHCHHTIVDRAVEDNWYVYQVEPLGILQLGVWDDVLTPSAKVLKCIGRARGIMKARPLPKDDCTDTRKYEWDWKLPSRVLDHQLPKGSKGKFFHKISKISYNPCYVERLSEAEGRKNLSLRERANLYSKLGIEVPSYATAGFYVSSPFDRLKLSNSLKNL
jgi:hypothetical protein